MPDNYTRNITFAKAHTNPIYMRVLKVLIDNKDHGIKRHEVLNITHNRQFTRTPNGWQIGPFHMLKYHNFATFERRGRNVFWKATPEGESFYNIKLVEKDLSCK